MAQGIFVILSHGFRADSLNISFNQPLLPPVRRYRDTVVPFLIKASDLRAGSGVGIARLTPLTLGFWVPPTGDTF